MVVMFKMINHMLLKLLKGLVDNCLTHWTNKLLVYFMNHFMISLIDFTKKIKGILNFLELIKK